ncbi:hypothetical protein EDD86DRAFT_211907 [Gorgonomyces haynaldii]|nr:hypothetical protein EDD86DRAFT_211907 [Gorgonomyces haynaldii]
MQCPQCNLVFNTLKERTDHRNRVHMSISHLVLGGTKYLIEKTGDKWPCPFVSNGTACGKLYSQPKGIRVHFESEHVNPQQFPCTVCPLIFNSKQERSYHINYVHQTTTTIKDGINSIQVEKRPDGWHCPVCDLVCDWAGSLSLHYRNKHTDQAFECKKCQILFPSRSQRDTHQLQHQTKTKLSDGDTKIIVKKDLNGYWRCPKNCEFKSKSPVALGQHFRTTHAPPAQSKIKRIHTQR